MRSLIVFICYLLLGTAHAQGYRGYVGRGGPVFSTAIPSVSTSARHDYGHVQNRFGHNHNYYSYLHSPYYYSNADSRRSSLVGYGSSAAANTLSYVPALEPDAEWTPMFADKPVRTKVVGVSVASMRGSAGGSYIFVGPGHTRGKPSEEFSSSVKDLPPPNTISWSK